MKSLVVSAILIFSSQTLIAETLFTCKGKSVLQNNESNKSEEPQLNDIEIHLIKDGDKFSLTFGKQTAPVEEVSQMNLKITQDFLNCNSEKEDCLENFYSKKETGEFNYVIPGAVLILSQAKSMGIPHEMTFNPSSVASAKMYHLAKPTKFGGWGLIELFDDQQNLIVRLFSAVEVFECK